MRAWLVVSHDGCTFVERREDLFEEPTGSLPGAAEIVGRRDFRSLVGGAARDPPSSAVACLAPRSDRPAGHGAVRPLVADRLAGLAGSRHVRALRRLRPAAADRGRSPASSGCRTPTSARSTGRRAGWRRSSPGGTPTARIPTSRAAAVEATRQLEPAAPRHRPSAPRPARGRRDQPALASWAARSRRTGASRTSSTTRSSCSRAARRRRRS